MTNGTHVARPSHVGLENDMKDTKDIKDTAADSSVSSSFMSFVSLMSFYSLVRYLNWPGASAWPSSAGPSRKRPMRRNFS